MSSLLENKGPKRRCIIGVLATLVLPIASGGCCNDREDKPAHAPVAPGPVATATAPAPTVAATQQPSANPLATLLTGEPPAEIKLMGVKSVKNQPITAKVPLGWATSRDDSSTDYVDDELHLWSKDNHAAVWIAATGATDSLTDTQIAFNTQRVRGQKVTFEAPIAGRFGKNGLEAKIAQGQGLIMKRPAEFWYALVKLDDKKSLIVFASARSDVYPKRRDELLAVVRSVSVQR